jgi:hypothetical protein
MGLPKDAKKTIYRSGDGTVMTFAQHPQFGYALEFLEQLGDAVAADKAKAAARLRSAGYSVAASEVEKMSTGEYEDFLVNNVY